MANLIEVAEVSKTYLDAGRKVEALKDVSFTLGKAEDLAIVGPSGSGKSTLLEIMGGLSTPTAGTVKIQGENIIKLSDSELSTFRNKTMGFIFQMIHLQDYLTAQENVMIPMLIAKKDYKESGERAKELLKKVGLEDRLDHRPSQLSGGEMQRVAIARALANNPAIILADEPTGKLDKDNSTMIMDLLEEISKDNGISVIVITHDIDIAKRFSRVIKIKHGEIISDQEYK